ncbi:MAG: cytochrome c oxidase accessory protein CcoG [Acidobacteriota bacterium]|nr:cytochrome c oxidase accessory protein CcoG [Acidobacteriota bacterium]MDQ7086677.1 cytochrome c oxidase accessory protein CcoG [Acidobacteriota bacterium]
MSRHVPEAEEQVLSTLNLDGSRRWIRPKLSKGRFYRRRLVVAWTLIAAFTAIPYLEVGGKPLMLLDIPRQQFTFFGKTFLATDTMLLMLLLVGIFITIFLLTAIFGRVWCGWACPQTIYMEFIYRPIERLFEGSRARQLKMDREGASAGRVLKYVAYLGVSIFVAHTFLAYFVGVDQLFYWIQQPPAEHPTAFAIMALVTLLMFADFAYFREQVCIVACPYGRFQSVLLDRNSLIVGYDRRRGEVRGRLGEQKKGPPPEGGAWGDCVDCRACVVTCPTGIDIRDGLQLECIGCTQCIDACDAVMEKLGRPRGLIRYSSQDALKGRKTRILRPRVVLYPLILALVFGMLVLSLARKQDTDVTILRGLGAPYTQLPGGAISNQVRIKLVNRSNEDRLYTFSLVDGEGVEMIAPENPIRVGAGKTGTTALFLNVLPGSFAQGERVVRIRIHSGEAFDREYEYRLLGPEGHGR